MAERDGAEGGLRLDLALVHYPVCNKHGEEIGSAVTNLDIHDIARVGRTYGIDTLYLVTPFADQQRLVGELVDHWLTGHGARANSLRREALSLVRVCPSLDELYAATAAKWQRRPTVLATSARPQQRMVGYGEIRQRLAAGEEFLLLFGTAWGLAPAATASVDGFLPPISGRGDYNHLSVRSAASIILDRLAGCCRQE